MDVLYQLSKATARFRPPHLFRADRPARLPKLQNVLLSCSETVLSVTSGDFDRRKGLKLDAQAHSVLVSAQPPPPSYPAIDAMCASLTSRTVLYHRTRTVAHLLVPQSDFTPRNCSGVVDPALHFTLSSRPSASSEWYAYAT